MGKITILPETTKDPISLMDAADTRSPVRGAACRNVLLIDAN